jgi:hypothetical protein
VSGEFEAEIARYAAVVMLEIVSLKEEPGRRRG